MLQLKVHANLRVFQFILFIHYMHGDEHSPFKSMQCGVFDACKATWLTLCVQPKINQSKISARFVWLSWLLLYTLDKSMLSFVAKQTNEIHFDFVFKIRKSAQSFNHGWAVWIKSMIEDNKRYKKKKTIGLFILFFSNHFYFRVLKIYQKSIN